MAHYKALLKTLPAVPGVRVEVEPLPAVAQALVQVKLHIVSTSDTCPMQ